MGHRALRGPSWLALALVAAAACEGSGGEGADAGRDAADVPAADAGADPGGGEDLAAGSPDVAVGTFLVSLVEAVPASGTAEATDAYALVVGKVYDGPTPDLVQWNEVLRDGDCRVMVPYVPFCAEGCGGGACVADDACQSYPAARSVGTVTVTGVRTASGPGPFTLDPVAKAYQTVDPLPFPPFDEGDAVGVAAAGGDLEAFSLASRGIAPLVLSADALALERDTDLPLSWTAAGQAGNSMIRVKLDISHHAGSKGRIECETEDDGSLAIGGALVTRLLDLGVSGFPTIVVARHAVGSTVVSAGRVDLDVVSDLEVAVDVPGVVSCNEDTDCPEGQACLPSLMCQ